MTDNAQTGLPPSATGWEPAPADTRARAAARLSGLAAHFEGWADANLHGVVMVHRGRLLYEHYFTGEDRAFARPLGRVAYHAGLRHDLRSITKSVVSLLVGIGVGEGWIGDLDTPVLALFPEPARHATPEKAAITLRHLLTMSAGLAWNEDLPYSDPANSERRMIDAPDRCGYVLAQPLVRTPGAAYRYNGGLTLLLATALERGSGRTIDALARDLLFAPLGIADVEWHRYDDGAANPVSGLRLVPRDVARLGELVLRGGRYAGRQVVPEGWIAESTAPQIHGEGLYFYGFHWWLGRSLVARREIRWIAGIGYGGQRLYIVPELDLVVAVTAGLYDEPVLQGMVGDVVLRRYALPAALEAG
ncbi:beta-lactamase family protein [Ancylobacter sp. MQZ15Z-1]|uniref:Beta-lactamase family protein n=1 Tax=Ancylobacter mangrovi TaxID=2972472 RepID=A0A9X2PAQ4_9HYPH|nr:serine hydrolase [Ancylobacter mangrovi]MCS0495254.1 beta-lactamase family protein [Ancylobacter mangrovi]